jgi:hypothetical protein
MLVWLPEYVGVSELERRMRIGTNIRMKRGICPAKRGIWTNVVMKGRICPVNFGCGTNLSCFS